MGKVKEYFSQIIILLDASLVYAIKVVGVAGIVWGVATLYDIFILRTPRTEPMSFESLLLGYGGVLCLAIFVGAFVRFTFKFFRGDKKAITKEVPKNVTFNVNPDFSNMNRTQIIAFFEGVSKLSPDQIMMLFDRAIVEAKQYGRRNTEAFKESTASKNRDKAQKGKKGRQA